MLMSLLAKIRSRRPCVSWIFALKKTLCLTNQLFISGCGLSTHHLSRPQSAAAQCLCAASIGLKAHLVAVYKLRVSRKVTRNLSVQFLIHASSLIYIFYFWRICMTPSGCTFLCVLAPASESVLAILSREANFRKARNLLEELVAGYKPWRWMWCANMPITHGSAACHPACCSLRGSSRLWHWRRHPHSTHTG